MGAVTGFVICLSFVVFFALGIGGGIPYWNKVDVGSSSSNWGMWNFCVDLTDIDVSIDGVSLNTCSNTEDLYCNSALGVIGGSLGTSSLSDECDKLRAVRAMYIISVLLVFAMLIFQILSACISAKLNIVAIILGILGFITACATFAIWLSMTIVIDNKDNLHAGFGLWICGWILLLIDIVVTFLAKGEDEDD